MVQKDPHISSPPPASRETATASLSKNAGKSRGKSSELIWFLTWEIHLLMEA